jgi:hypothetical protein
MAQYNPMLEKLQQDIENHNKQTEAMMEKVAQQQNRITILLVVVTIIIFVILQALFGGRELIKGLDNTVLNLISTIILLLLSFPTAAKYGKKGLKALKLNEEQIEPKLNYAGEWAYKTNFRIQSREEDSDEYRRFKENMEDYKEEGTTTWTQNVFDLKINFGITNVTTKNTQQTCTSNQTSRDSVSIQSDSKTSNVKPPRISWQSAPATYDEKRIHWSFSGKIWWGDDEVYCNDFYGIESYNVTEHDEQGRPSQLVGHLVGIVIVGKRFFALDGLSEFIRK